MSKHEARLPAAEPGSGALKHKRYWAAGVVVLLTLVLVGALVVVPRSLESASDPSVVDSDGDGIADQTEITGWIGARGERFITDASNSDTDGDGLSGVTLLLWTPKLAGPRGLAEGCSYGTTTSIYRGVSP